MQKRILAIDDQRPHPTAHILARTYHDGIKALTLFPKWDVLLLDHDLGDIEKQYEDGSVDRELTGYHVLCFLEENPQYLPGEIILVTSNPSGRIRMKQVVDKLYKRGEYA